MSLPAMCRNQYPFLNSFGVSQLREDTNRNHRELMREIGKDRLSVQVLAPDLAPVVESAYQNVSIPADDYNRAYSIFRER